MTGSSRKPEVMICIPWHLYTYIWTCRGSVTWFAQLASSWQYLCDFETNFSMHVSNPCKLNKEGVCPNKPEWPAYVPTRDRRMSQHVTGVCHNAWPAYVPTRDRRMSQHVTGVCPNTWPAYVQHVTGVCPTRGRRVCCKFGMWLLGSSQQPHAIFHASDCLKSHQSTCFVFDDLFTCFYNLVDSLSYLHLFRSKELFTLNALKAQVSGWHNHSFSMAVYTKPERASSCSTRNRRRALCVWRSPWRRLLMASKLHASTWTRNEHSKRRGCCFVVLANRELNHDSNKRIDAQWYRESMVRFHGFPHKFQQTFWHTPLTSHFTCTSILSWECVTKTCGLNKKGRRLL